MGRNKRKTVSPLHRDGGKTPRTADVDDDGRSQAGQDGDGDVDVITDLKEFIRSENARNSKSLAEEIRRHNDERMTALETSLSFALTTNETLAKRLGEVEQRAQQADKNYRHQAERLAVMEEQLDQLQQREMQGWLVFSGPAIARGPRSSRGEDTARQLRDLIQSLMNYDLDMRQIGEVQRDERQIRVHFTTVAAGSDRFFLVRNKTRLRGTGLYIRERLTPVRQWLFNELMKLKRNSLISTVFTREGTVFVVTSQHDRPRPVRSEAALERLWRHLAEQSANQRTEPSHLPRQPPRVSPGATEATPAVGGGDSADPGGAAVARLGDSASRSASLRRTLSRSPQDVNTERRQHLYTDGGGREIGEERTWTQVVSVPLDRGLPAAATLPAVSAAAGTGPGPAAIGSTATGAGSDAATGTGPQPGDSESGGGCGIGDSAPSAPGKGRGRAAAGGGTSAGRVGGRRDVMASASGVRHRFGGDIRKFVRGGHSKVD